MTRMRALVAAATLLLGASRPPKKKPAEELKFMLSTIDADRSVTDGKACTPMRDVAALSRRRHPGRPRYDVFVAGVEGAGHHGVVSGFLAPLIAETTGTPLKHCVLVTEMPFTQADYDPGLECPASAAVGWESFPSKRRVTEPERLSLLYAGPHCFDDRPSGARGLFPGHWAPAVSDDCYRCGGDWRATLEDALERHRRSDRLDVRLFQRSVPSLKVVFLWRDFAHAVFSHPPWDGGGRGHALMIAVQLATLAEDAAALDARVWRVLRYESLADDYGAAAEAVAAFLGLAHANGTAFAPGHVAAAAARVRADKWRRPSSKHEAAATADTADARAVREVEAYFGHRFAIFHRADVQLLPFARNASDVRVEPRAASAACPEPRFEPCRRCAAKPILRRNGTAERYCRGPPPGGALHCCRSED